ncbi:hypothetical protein LTS18_000319, partial [Coniosporium uncinatum]
TSEASFYETVVAEVYLISGNVTVHGHPAWDCLQAIVANFKGKTRPNRKPFLIFLSDPSADVDAPMVNDNTKIRNKSEVKRLLTSAQKPSAIPPDPTTALDPQKYYYEIWRLAKRANATDGAFGTLSFGYKSGTDPVELVVGMNTDNTKGRLQWTKLGPA